MGTNVDNKLDQIIEKLNSSDIVISNSIFNPPNNNCLFNNGWTNVIINYSGTSSYGNAAITLNGGQSLLASISQPTIEHGQGPCGQYIIYNTLINLNSISKIIIYSVVSYNSHANPSSIWLFLLDKTIPFEIIKTGYPVDYNEIGNPMKDTMPLSDYIIEEFEITIDSFSSTEYKPIEVDLSEYNNEYYIGLSRYMSRQNNNQASYNMQIEQIRFE